MATKKSKKVVEEVAEEVAVAVATPPAPGLVESMDLSSLGLPKEKEEALTKLVQMLTGNVEGLDEDEEYYFRPSYLSLVQQMTRSEKRGDAKNGDFVADALTVCTKGTPMRLFPIMTWMERSHMVKGENKPVCRSVDTKYSVQGDECSKCPHEKWIGRGKGSKPPSCREQRKVLFLSEDLSEIYLVTFQKMSADAGKAIRNAIVKAGGVGKLAILLSSDFRQTTEYEYYIFKARRDATPPSDGECEVIQALARRFRQDRIGMLARAAERRDAEPAADNGDGTTIDVETAGEDDDVAM